MTAHLSFDIPNNLQGDLIDLSREIGILHQRILSFSEAEKTFIKKCARISNIGATTRIENALLTDCEVAYVDTLLTADGRNVSYKNIREEIRGKLSKDKERSLDEVVGCRGMLQIIFDQYASLYPLTGTAIRGLHQELLNYYAPAKDFAGKYKTKPNSVVRLVSGKTFPVLTTAEPGIITQQAMDGLITWYNQAIKSEPWSLAVVTEFVYRFLAIHPFQDGNGRLGRGLFVLALLHGKDSYLAETLQYLPIDREIERRREEYYLSLKQCSQGKFLEDSRGYNYLPILQFFIKIISATFDSINYYRAKYQNLQNLSPSALKVLECFQDQPEQRLGTKTICAISGMPRQTVIAALNSLVEKNFIQRNGLGAGTRYQLVF